MKKVTMTIITLLMMCTLSACGSTTINLNDYVTITTEGYDSMGTATYTFDYAQLEADYADQVEVKVQTEEIKFEQAFGIEPIDIMKGMCIHYEMGERSDLSNGDVLMFTWDIDEEAAEEYFGCKLEYEDITHKVSGLVEVDTFDPFEYLTVTFSGISPKAKVEKSIDYAIPAMQYIEFGFDEGSFLEKGQTITATAELDYTISIEEFVEKFGMLPGVTEKTYTVDGVPYYLTDASEIPEEEIEGTIDNFKEYYEGYVDENWSDAESLENIEYVGSYFLKPKPNSSVYTQNYFYMIYKITATYPNTGENIEFYMYCYYKDMLNAGEAIEWGMGEVPSTGWSKTEYFVVGDYYYIGYQTLEELYQEHIVSKIGSYEYTTDIKE